jgi:hypothetical protein
LKLVRQLERLRHAERLFGLARQFLRSVAVASREVKCGETELQNASENKRAASGHPRQVVSIIGPTTLNDQPRRAAGLPPFICASDRDNYCAMDDRTLSVRWILAGKAPQDAPVTVKGWVRTRRDSKAGISFVHLSDGSSFHPVQVVAPNTLPNYGR